MIEFVDEHKRPEVVKLKAGVRFLTNNYAAFYVENDMGERQDIAILAREGDLCLPLIDPDVASRFGLKLVNPEKASEIKTY